MKTKAKQHVIIIGAGIIGLSTAYALLTRRPSLNLTVLEAGKEAGRGASWANGSMIHPSQAWPWPEARSVDAQKVAVESFKLAQRSSVILRQHFKDFDLALRHRKSGTVKLYANAKDMDAGLRALEVLASHGLRYTLWGRKEISQNLGVSSAAYIGAVYFPDDHSGPARIYCSRLIKAITQIAGRDSIQIDHAVASASQGFVTLEDGTRVIADDIIICAGAQAKNIAGLAVDGVRGYSRTYHSPGLGFILPPIPIMDDRAHISVTPLGDHLRISGGAQYGEAIDTNMYASFERYVFDLLPDLKPRFEAAQVSDWSAIRPMSAEGPIIGRVTPQLWANTGHGHMGWTQCAGAAAQFADSFFCG